jgi:hypothetical protein
MPQIVIYKPENTYPQQLPGTGVGFDRLRLKAGSNHLSDTEFESLSQHPDYPAYVARKALVVHEPKEEVEPVPLSEIPKDLSAYNVDESGDIIDGTHDADVLKVWQKADNRVSVKRAISQRLKDLGGEG